MDVLFNVNVNLVAEPNPAYSIRPSVMCEQFVFFRVVDSTSSIVGKTHPCLFEGK